jgi:hypothetical protein
MDSFFYDLALYDEAMCVEHNWPCTRRFTHDELQPAIMAIRQIEAAKLKVAMSAEEIDRAMMEAISGKGAT